MYGGVWTQLQDIHEAFGLRYQWGGSHCNKALLCCLGIDTRNIVSTRCSPLNASSPSPAQILFNIDCR